MLFESILGSEYNIMKQEGYLNKNRLTHKL